MLIQQLSKSAFVARGLRMIDEGLLDDAGIENLAERLGVGERHLRRLFQEELGASPATVAQTRRILFARQLLEETRLSMTEVAMAAGFGSIRRFNDVMQQTYHREPRKLRGSASGSETSEISVSLPYNPPYNWQAVLRFLEARATRHVESITDGVYKRTVAIDGKQGTVAVTHNPESLSLRLSIDFPNVAALTQIVAKVRQIFDVAANVEAIHKQFRDDPILAGVAHKAQGLRVPGTWDSFELAVRAILGQQVSVAAATTICGRIAEKYGTPFVSEYPELTRIFPTAAILASADLTTVGVTKARAQAISNMSAMVAENDSLLRDCASLDEAVATLSTLPGIGMWTAHYIAMRALREPDAFPSNDLHLLRAAKTAGLSTAKQLLQHAERWRPWRAYAAMYLWQAPHLVS